jgi:hypothetical protein
MNPKSLAKRLLADVLQLDSPAVAAGVASAIVADTGLFGIDLGSHGGQLLAVLTAAGAIATAVKKAVGQFTAQPEPTPAPAPVPVPVPIPVPVPVPAPTKAAKGKSSK